MLGTPARPCVQVGTTLCAYNLFLQSAAVAEAARARRVAGAGEAAALRRDLCWVRLDTAASAAIGGLISASLVAVAASVHEADGGGDAASAGEPGGGGGEGEAGPAGGVGGMARGVAALLGPLAGQGFALGLCAAGLSSAVSAPLAARLAVAELLPSRPAAASLAWVIVAVAGAAIAAMPGLQPVGVILFAQCLNALLLPLLAAAVLVVASQPQLLGPFRCTRPRPGATAARHQHERHIRRRRARATTRCPAPPVTCGCAVWRRSNGRTATLAGGTVVALTLALSIKSLL